MDFSHILKKLVSVKVKTSLTSLVDVSHITGVSEESGFSEGKDFSSCLE